jgi:dipeptidyl aminopeptidase/acylaminoacyl peptidase
VRRPLKRLSIASFVQCLVVSLTLAYAGLASPLATASVSEDQTKRGRPMTPADLLALQSITGVALSPDGKWAAVVVERPKKAGEAFHRNNIRDERRCDIWLVSTNSGSPVNLTRGDVTRAGYWSPVWSPDGRRLAMVSTAGRDNVRAYIYDLASRRLRRLTRAGVDLNLRIQSQGEQEAASIAWLDSTSLLVGLLPPGIRPLGFDERQRTSSIASAGLAEAMRGRVPTARILTTGDVKASAPPRANVALTAIDVTTGAQRKIAHIPLVETRLAERLVSLSPRQEYAAILATDPPLPSPKNRKVEPHDLYPMRLGITALGGQADVKWISGVRPAVLGFGGPLSPVRWAATDPVFAVVGSPNDDDISVPSPFVVSARDARAQHIRVRPSNAGAVEVTKPFAAEDVQWSSDGRLLVYGHARTTTLPNARAESDQRTARRDWWLVAADGSSRNLTAEMPAQPQRLLPTQRPGVMLAHGGGRLWSVDLSTTKITAINATNGVAVNIAWPAFRGLSYQVSNFASPQPTDEVLLVSPNNAGANLYLANLSSATPVWREIGSMPPNASIREYSPRSKTAIYQTADTRLYAINANDSKPIELISLNRGLDRIVKPEYRFFEYRSTDDKPLTGALLLPIDYRPGRRYPLLVRIYPGPPAPRGDWASPHRSDYLHPLLFASRGYAVLVPSVPMGPHGVPSDPMLEFDKGVKPAIEKVVEMGIADPEKLGIIGVSFGGYSVYGLITQTPRFKAAVALAGITDLFGYYGTLDLRYRFSDGLLPLLFPWGTESQQMSMGTTPWKDPARYLRNSPYVFVDRVNTPLLMIHGDMDGVLLTQAEQFFVGLARVGKRGKLLRYLGEGHGIESPANVLDMWEQILSWFDEFLMRPEQPQAARGEPQKPK